MDNCKALSALLSRDAVPLVEVERSELIHDSKTCALNVLLDPFSFRSSPHDFAVSVGPR